MGKKTPPCPLWKEWTEARFKTFLKSLLRQGSQRWPPGQEIMKRHRRKYQGSDSRTKWEYQCNHCKEWFKQKEIARDHVDEVGGFSDDFNNWPQDLGQIAERMFCGVEGYQLLCTECHKSRTDKQRKDKYE